MTASAAGGDAVVIERVTKRFGATVALDGISGTVQRGELFGYIGPDGGGKTTLFRILATLLLPDEGTATVLGRDAGRDLWALRRVIGYMPGRFSLYPDLSVRENLQFFASVFGTTIEREYRYIAPIYSQLEPFAERRAGALSGGMKQKLALCCALVHRPELLLLDEPTTGVDAVSRRELWEMLGVLRHDGLTIVVSTPYMDEADRCDRVTLIQGGRVLATDTPAAVARSYDRPLLAVRVADRYAALRVLRAMPSARAVYPFGAALHYADARVGMSGEAVQRDVAAALAAAGLAAEAIAPTTPTIEDVFIARMGGTALDAGGAAA